MGSIDCAESVTFRPKSSSPLDVSLHQRFTPGRFAPGRYLGSTRQWLFFLNFILLTSLLLRTLNQNIYRVSLFLLTHVHNYN